MSHAFAHLKYPERYVHLFSEESGNAIKTAANNAHHIANAYVTLVRPPFYHWLMDTIPHLYGASRLGHMESVTLIAPDSMTFHPWQKSLLKRAATAFGINNLTYTPTNGTVVAVRPGFSQTHMPLADRLALLRLIAPRAGAKKPWRFLYSRRGPKERRQLHNEDAVIAALGGRFTVIDPGEMDLPAQMSLFAEARCVAGVHGSNLTNIAFCQPGTAVVEIAAGLPQPHFERLAEAAGLRFMRVEADPVAPDSKDKTWAQAHGDLTVDPAAVLTVIDEVLAGP
jgi:capsular polysaccharide biosynthesis protein